MNKGYCYAYRSAWTHPIFNDLLEASIWNYLYQNAFYERGERTFNGQKFTLERGQIIVSVSFLSKGFRTSDKHIRGLLKRLSEGKMVDIQRASKGTIITICKYGEFQENKYSKGNQKATKRQSKGNNNNKGIKESNNKDINNVFSSLNERVDKEIFNQYIQDRNDRKSPMTDRAIKMAINKLNNLEEKGYNANEIIKTTIRNGWKDFYEPKNGVSTHRSGGQTGDRTIKDLANEYGEI